MWGPTHDNNGIGPSTEIPSFEYQSIDIYTNVLSDINLMFNIILFFQLSIVCYFKKCPFESHSDVLHTTVFLKKISLSTNLSFFSLLLFQINIT